MQSIILLITLDLVDQNQMDEWKRISDHITAELQGVDGFIYRDSAIGDDGKIYCILKWESLEKHDAFSKKLQENEDFKNDTIGFAKIVNMATMKSEVIKVI